MLKQRHFSEDRLTPPAHGTTGFFEGLRVYTAAASRTSSCLRFIMEEIRRNKTAIEDILCADYGLILNKVDEKRLISRREYGNLKSINREDVWGHVVALVDKIMNKGDDTCKAFLDLLQSDEDIKTTYPQLKDIQWNDISPAAKPVQATSLYDTDPPSHDNKRRKENEQYKLNSRPTGLCFIINNEKFEEEMRNGTNKDAESLAEVFSWLGFRVLMCKDQAKDQMDRALTCFASPLGDPSQLQEFSVKEWSGGKFIDLKVAPTHGDAFICCILSHGVQGAVLGIDREPLSLKQIRSTFKATDQSPLTGKPKVFVIQACQGGQKQRGVLLKDLETDECCSSSVPEYADFLFAIATVEDCVSFRHRKNGSWFIQCLCQQLEEDCPRGECMTAILKRVNNDVSKKEGSSQPGKVKQMPESHSSLRKDLVLSPYSE